MKNPVFFGQLFKQTKLNKTFTKKYINDLNFVKTQIDIQDNQNSSATIASTNLKNKYQIGKQEEVNKVIIELLKSNTSIIGTQEVTKKNLEKLDKVLKQYDYHITGDFRWGNGIVGLVFDIANEGNQIISKNEIYMSKTNKLPWFPRTMKDWKVSLKAGSVMPRIATSCVTNINGIGYCRIYNTHLDYGNCKIQKKQMSQLLNIVDRDQCQISLPVVITGDWNATLESENMKYFTHELNERGINIANNNQTTFKGKFSNDKMTEPPKVLDYIATSNDLNIKDIEIITNPQSDHDILKGEINKRYFR